MDASVAPGIAGFGVPVQQAAAVNVALDSFILWQDKTSRPYNFDSE